MDNFEVPDEEEGVVLTKMSKLPSLSKKFEKNPFFIVSKKALSELTQTTKQPRQRSRFSISKTIDDVDGDEPRKAKAKSQTSLKPKRAASNKTKSKRKKSADPTKKPANTSKKPKSVAQKALQKHDPEEPDTPTFLLP